MSLCLYIISELNVEVYVHFGLTDHCVAGSGNLWCGTICVNINQAALRAFFLTRLLCAHALHVLFHLVQQIREPALLTFDLRTFVKANDFTLSSFLHIFQIKKLYAIKGDDGEAISNFRPLQPLNGRVVRSSFPIPKQSGATKTQTFSAILAGCLGVLALMTIVH